MYHLCNAIIPYYDSNGGNATYTLLLDGTKRTFDTPIRRYTSKMYYDLLKDPVAIRNWSSDILSTKSLNPLILFDSCVFIPVKFRIPVSHLDGAFGYVLSSAVKSYKGGIITLIDGTTIHTLSSDKHIANKLRDAKLLGYAYRDRFDLF